MTPKPFSVDNNKYRLTIKDLLEARDLYHVHLMNKRNVVATAVGRFRVRKTDDWPDKKGMVKRPGPMKPQPPKTLENSEIRYYSYPALLVFVDTWVGAAQFRREKKWDPDDRLPEAVYMPDGRVIPICVIKAPKSIEGGSATGNLVFPRNVIGGGFPVIVEVQEQQHVASIGCLVTDGHMVYAMTNRHVCGEPGKTIYSIFGGNRVPIGRSSSKQLSRQLFTEIYPGWHGRDTYVNLDVGLIEIDDINYWTSNVYGIPKLNKMRNLSWENMSLDLIGCPVRAYGAASREMFGEIHAMFYRYKSEGGFEYVADFFIGPRRRRGGGFSTAHGDSGTIWFVDLPDDESTHLTPLAVQWGGQVFAGNEKRMPYALATCLSTVCNQLGVDILNDWETELPYYWGALGHYSLATFACEAVKSKKLKKLLDANLDRISFQMEDLSKKNVSGLSKQDFVPLADVPDLVWKMGPHKRSDNLENPNHFADMDKPDPHTGKSLIQICKDPGKINPKEWIKYYEAVEDESRGILPFRIWQIYSEMVRYVKKGLVAEFVCAAGILSHYVADACQPLHISYLYDGDPDGEKEEREVYDRTERQKVLKKVPISKGVHGDFDRVMVEYHTTDILNGVPPLIKKKAGVKAASIKGGHEAAMAAVDLMRRSLDTVKPSDACRFYAENRKLAPKKRSVELWKTFGDGMIEVMADGAATLARLWDSAWKEGHGDTKIPNPDAVPAETLRDIYVQRDFLPSCNIETISKHLK